MNGAHTDVLKQALEAELGLRLADLSMLFTDDVVGWSPSMSVSGRDELARLADDRSTAFSDAALRCRTLDEVGNRAFAEWVIEANHTAPFMLDEGAKLEPTGRRIRLAGATVADFRDDKIRSFRTYFDEASLVEQLVG